MKIPVNTGSSLLPNEAAAIKGAASPSGANTFVTESDKFKRQAPNGDWYEWTVDNDGAGQWVLIP
jgi:hypothetical protein